MEIIAFGMGIIWLVKVCKNTKPGFDCWNNDLCSCTVGKGGHWGFPCYSSSPIVLGLCSTIYKKGPVCKLNCGETIHKMCFRINVKIFLSAYRCECWHKKMAFCSKNRDAFIPAWLRLFCCCPENAGSVSICGKLLFNAVSNVPLWSHQYLQAWGLNFSLRKFHKLRNVCHQSSSSYAVPYYDPHSVWAQSSSCFWYAVNNNLVDMLGRSLAGVIVEVRDPTLTADNPSDTLA